MQYEHWHQRLCSILDHHNALVPQLPSQSRESHDCFDKTYGSREVAEMDSWPPCFLTQMRLNTIAAPLSVSAVEDFHEAESVLNYTQSLNLPSSTSSRNSPFRRKMASCLYDSDADRKGRKRKFEVSDMHYQATLAMNKALDVQDQLSHLLMEASEIIGHNNERQRQWFKRGELPLYRISSPVDNSGMK